MCRAAKVAGGILGSVIAFRRTHAFAFTVNGQAVQVDAEPDTPLLWVLRDYLNLTGTKFGCGVAVCGACTVHLDGQPLRSCVIPVSACEGKHVTTIEGLKQDGSLHPVQQAWIDHQVPQCGYCQSGMIMAAAALLSRQPPSERRGHRRCDHQHLPLRHLPARQARDPRAAGACSEGLARVLMKYPG